MPSQRFLKFDAIRPTANCWIKGPGSSIGVHSVFCALGPLFFGALLLIRCLEFIRNQFVRIGCGDWDIKAIGRQRYSRRLDGFPTSSKGGISVEFPVARPPVEGRRVRWYRSRLPEVYGAYFTGSKRVVWGSGLPRHGRSHALTCTMGIRPSLKSITSLGRSSFRSLAPSLGSFL